MNHTSSLPGFPGKGGGGVGHENILIPYSISNASSNNSLINGSVMLIQCCVGTVVFNYKIIYILHINFY